MLLFLQSECTEIQMASDKLVMYDRNGSNAGRWIGSSSQRDGTEQLQFGPGLFRQHGDEHVQQHIQQLTTDSTIVQQTRQCHQTQQCTSVFCCANVKLNETQNRNWNHLISFYWRFHSTNQSSAANFAKTAGECMDKTDRRCEHDESDAQLQSTDEQHHWRIVIRYRKYGDELHFGSIVDDRQSSGSASWPWSAAHVGSGRTSADLRQPIVRSKYSRTFHCRSKPHLVSRSLCLRPFGLPPTVARLRIRRREGQLVLRKLFRAALCADLCQVWTAHQRSK